MKKTISPKVFLWLRFAFMFFAAGACALMTLAFITGFEQTSHYFVSTTQLPTVAFIFTALAISIATVDAILTPTPDITHKNDFKIAPIFAGIGFIVAGIQRMVTASSSLGMVCAILLIVSAVHCVFSFLNKKEYSLLTFYLGCASILGCAMLTMQIYFDMTIEMNAPIKFLPQITLLCSMLFYTAELRPLIDRAAPRVYRILCAITVAIGAISSLPLLIACCLNKITRKGDLRIDILCIAILLLGITITATLRLISLYRSDKNEDEKTVTDVTE